MRLQFLNRNKEIRRLKKAILNYKSSFLVIYGRRRVGKSTLLQKIIRPNDIYFLADQSDKFLQIQNLAVEISRVIPGFNEMQYPNWDSLFNNFIRQCKKNIILILDEFPYLVTNAPELPSVLQKIIDQKNLRFHLIICGSSQRMMHGLVMDKTAPLYGRAREILKIKPLRIGWMKKAFKYNSADYIKAYSIWGGIPGYWELASQFTTLPQAIKYLILDRDGVLHNEPWRILTDDLRSTVQTNSLLTLIAYGCHRLSEISTRIQKPATSLTRPLSNLIDLGYIKREIPYGESIKSTKHTLYKLNDPFLCFYYRYIQPNKSLLEVDLINDVYNKINLTLNSHTAGVWEDLARTSTAFINIGGIKWGPANRWWGKGKDGKQIEIDIAAESIDKKYLLIGEVKWGENLNIIHFQKELEKKTDKLPFIKKRKIILAYWLKSHIRNSSKRNIILPQDILKYMR